MAMAPTSTWVACFLAVTVLRSIPGRHAGAAAADCSNVVYDMMSCLEYVTQGSNVTEPTAACCIGVASVLKTSHACLCKALKEAVAMGVAVNLSRASSLPDACSVKIPPGKHCSVPLPTSASGASPAQPPAKAPSISPAPQSRPPTPPPPRTAPPSPAPSPASPTAPEAPSPASLTTHEAPPMPPTSPEPSPAESGGAPAFVSSAVVVTISVPVAVVLLFV